MHTILIVEDHDKNLKLVRDLLQHRGYATLEATTGTDGLRLAREHHPDLVLLDIQLPDIDGIEVLRRIRADAACAAMPVVAVSASVMPSERREVIASGFDGFVSKPIDIQAFLSTVAHCLAQGRGVA